MCDSLNESLLTNVKVVPFVNVFFEVVKLTMLQFHSLSQTCRSLLGWSLCEIEFSALKYVFKGKIDVLSCARK